MSEADDKRRQQLHDDYARGRARQLKPIVKVQPKKEPQCPSKPAEKPSH